jgi:hypothetical protein
MNAAIKALANAIFNAQFDSLDAQIIVEEAKDVLQVIAAHNYAVVTLNNLRALRADATLISTRIPYAIRQSYAAHLSQAIAVLEKTARAESVKEIVWAGELAALAEGDTEMLAAIDTHIDSYIAAHSHHA